MLQSLTQFPTTGSLCFRQDTAEPARIIRHNADHTVLLQRRRRLLDGSTVPLDGASANITVPLDEVFEQPELAVLRTPRGRRRARGGRV